MRNFGETSELKGKIAKRKGRSYVIQKEGATRLHGDFGVDLDGVPLS
ncbi:MAG: hypothetical protein ABL956_03750 [Hyphomonadaceae bacterium]